MDQSASDDAETIRARLAEAMAWFALHEHSPGFPRTPTLAPHNPESIVPSEVRRCVEARHAQLDASSLPQSFEGRLLAYSPDETVWDGASEAVSGEFFDVHDAPPWDLWLGWMIDPDRREYLVSWVPPMFVEPVQNGIDVNPVECIWWLPELEEALGLEVA